MLFIENCGLMLEPQLGMSPVEVVEWAKYAERVGFGYVFRSDHLLSTSGEKGVDTPECWVTLGMIAASTKRIGFGPMVSPVGWRNPALLAKMACTIHSFSGGRLMLGLGTGWYQAEYLGHGYEFPRFRVRREQFEEALQIIRSLTERGQVDFKGAHFSANTECCPRPKGKFNLIIGGRSPQIVKTAAKYADEWNIFSSPLDEFLRLKEIAESETARELTISMMGHSILAENKRDLLKRMRTYAKLVKVPGNEEEILKRIRTKGVICGNVENFVAEINKRREAGIQRFYFQVLDPEDRELPELIAETLKNEF